MAGTAQIPSSNPAGNNQMSPGAGLPKSGAMPITPIVGPNAPQNPFIPPGSGTGNFGRPNPLTTGQIPASGAPAPVPGATVPNVGGLTTTGANVAGDTGAVNKQLTDIYGKGVGGALASLLEGMSGTDSQVLQDYIASLQPQMAKAQSNTNAALGAGGVSANSSVAAIADSNLQSQETASIAGESAKLTLGQEELTANILQGMQGAASKEVATSGWSVFGDVMNQITGDIGNLIPGGSTYSNNNGVGGGTPGPAMSSEQLGNLDMGAPPSTSGLTGFDEGLDMSPFS